MKKALKDHTRDVLAIFGLVVVGLVASWIIVQNQRLRVPLIEEKPFQLRAELETAQAVTPGQGQTVRVAGVRVGDIAEVEVSDDNAVVTMDIDKEFLPVYRDATILLRPKTGLKDMFLELDPGNPEAGEFEEGDTIPVANTAPDVNLDEVLQALDGDTRAYLRLLITGAGDGLAGNGENLGEMLGSLGPINRSLARLNGQVAKRKENLARLIHNMNVLFERVGSEDDEIAALIDASNSSLSAIAGEDLDVRRATRLLGPTLRDTRIALTETNDLATILGPALQELRPFARRLKPINESLEELASKTTGDIKTEIRPFVRAAREPVRDLRPAAKSLADATPRLTVIAGKLNKLGNMAAYNPNGAEPPGSPGRDEGYLYWLGWLGHVGNSTFQAQDAHGVYRRIYFTASCQTILTTLNATPLSALITNIGPLLAPTGPCS
jgi:phospholipid/cholesterol/gamma-HCH transport system substrate-binding protein